MTEHPETEESWQHDRVGAALRGEKIQGNYDAFLHAHVWPRYEWEGFDQV